MLTGQLRSETSGRGGGKNSDAGHEPAYMRCLREKNKDIRGSGRRRKGDQWDIQLSRMPSPQCSHPLSQKGSRRSLRNTKEFNQTRPFRLALAALSSLALHLLEARHVSTFEQPYPSFVPLRICIVTSILWLAGFLTRNLALHHRERTHRVLGQEEAVVSPPGQDVILSSI